MSVWAEAIGVFASFLTNDSFEMTNALRTDGAYLAFAILTVVAGGLMAFLFKRMPLLDRHLERTIIIYAYLIIAWIIFSGVIQRFVLSGQPPWSSTIPPLIFMVMVWFGCSFNVKLRTHLSFSEFRSNMPARAQLVVLSMDAVLWLVFCVICMTTTARIAANSSANFQIVLGTDGFMQWWFIITVPIAFIVMAGRVIENLFEDYDNYRNGRPLIEQAVIGGDT
ncbi:TRAP transporter small permease subunit [uncultured Tateyamaria sp.]|uniref:TRAP transporter small permease n=1 Tax=uncultured Tateyamaria sp. TaxID=455651 RepID=UPI00262A2543|nr:TRAP transporter small permease subunit [uncultured Tateyamaria sp.]